MPEQFEITPGEAQEETGVHPPPTHCSIVWAEEEEQRVFPSVQLPIESDGVRQRSLMPKVTPVASRIPKPAQPYEQEIVWMNCPLVQAYCTPCEQYVWPAVQALQ